MLPAYEATYHDGVVDLKERPLGVDRARVIVTFVDLEADAKDAASVDERVEAVRRLQTMLSDVPQSRSLSEEIIEERRAEAVHD